MNRKKTWIIGGAGIAFVAVLAGFAPAAYNAYLEYRIAQRRQLIEAATRAVRAGDDAMPPIAGALIDPDENEGPEEDDPALRQLATEIEIGPRTPQQTQELLRIARQETARWANLGGQASLVPSPSVQGTRRWNSLGPSAARLQFNGTYYRAEDSGRASAIKVDPSRPSTVYLAVSGGGLWRTDDFGDYPVWRPMTDALGALAIGAMDLDPTTPGVIWIGLGDPFDQAVGAVAKSIDGGETWSEPMPLNAAIHPADGLPTAALNVRDLKIDPGDPGRILVAADDGLYVSDDAGATFRIVDLPNTEGAPRRESTWSIAYLGSDAGRSSWAVSGVWACPGAGVKPANLTAGVAACRSDATQANWGDIWTTADSAATWVSARASGRLPGSITGPGTPDLGRIQLGAGAPLPAATTMYAECENVNEAGSFTAAILKTTDSGATWTAPVVNTAPNTPANPPNLINPTVLGDCNSLDIGHAQSWYNLSVAVDPTDANHALFGGNLCGVRTLDGGATFENAAHWLPQGGSGYVAPPAGGDGFLPYVHADWHTATAVVLGDQFFMFAGTDGGLFFSQDIFTAPSGTLVNWAFPDVGLSDHLMYSVGTGDPVFGNESVVFGGLQDNGTRFRLIQDENFIFDFNVQNWDQIIGGDGVGCAVTRTALGAGKTYWASLPGSRSTCRPGNHDCSKATRIENGVEVSNWRRHTAPAALRPATDPEPFFIRYSPVNDEQSSVLTASTFQVFKVSQGADDLVTYRRVSPALTGTAAGALLVAGTIRQVRGQGPFASPYVYSIDGTPSRVYGLPLSGGASGLIVDSGAATSFVPAATALSFGGNTISFSQCVALPADPAHLGGTDIRQTWLFAVSGLATDQGRPISADMGHLFKTVNGGATWQPFHGGGAGLDLPNVPVYIVRFDPSDPSDQTIWAGTEFGVYRSTDGGFTWARYGIGLPQVRIVDIQISSNGGLVRVATYGRGVWEIRPHGEAAVATAAGDWDGNHVIDYFDLAGLTNRLGTTPTMTHDPSDPQYDYDNTLDLVIGAAPLLDEADLSALLAKFGGRP